jgi:O-antigen/teichoic acid export membrane protein
LPDLSVTPERRMQRQPDVPAADGPPRSLDRGETPAQRADRNLNELLQELRVAQTGVQLLFGFLLAIAFTSVFSEAAPEQKVLYVATLLCCAFSFVLLVGPVPAHRILFQAKAKMVVVVWSHYLTMAGLVALALSVSGSLVLAVWQAADPSWAIGLGLATLSILICLWFVLPAALRLSVTRHPESGGDPR